MRWTPLDDRTVGDGAAAGRHAHGAERGVCAPARTACRGARSTSSGIDLRRKLSQLTRDERTRLIDTLVRGELPWTGDEGYKKAEVTGGGVPCRKSTRSTMESKRHPGLFLCGEMLDAFGPIGGYNFLWAWATGRAAGIGAARKMICSWDVDNDEDADCRGPCRQRRVPAAAARTAGIRRAHAATAQQAREELTTWKPELVLMDLMLPDVEGLDLLHDFRGSARQRK